MLKTPIANKSHLPEQVGVTRWCGEAIVNMVLRYELLPRTPISNEWHRLHQSPFEYNVIGLPEFVDNNIVTPGSVENFIVTVRHHDTGTMILRAFKYGHDLVSTDAPYAFYLVEQLQKDLLRQP